MLLLSVIFDIAGMLSYLLPGIAETTDIVWAPAAAALYYMMYRRSAGLAGASFTLLEELMPFTDIIPTFTATWLYVYVLHEQKSLEQFRASLR